MTEAQWLECGSPPTMAGFLRRGARAFSGRKCRLFAVACCRRIWHLLPGDRCRAAVEVTEQYLDGLAGEEEQRAAAAAIEAVLRGLPPPGAPNADPTARFAAQAAALTVTDLAAGAAGSFAAAALAWGGPGPYGAPVDDPTFLAEKKAQAEVLRDVFGNPFRPVTCSGTWRTPQALAIARTAYEDRQFKDLPLLADALEEAGCVEEAVLAHLRGSGPHVRGCWVLDLLLDKN